MHKCSSCGADFDGNYCPMCGKQYIDDKAIAPSKMKFVKKVYSLLYYLPAILLIIFSFILFASSMLPIAISPSMEIMGEKIQSESYGNVYQLAFDSSTELFDINQVFIALIVMLILTLVYSITAADIRAVKTLDNKKIVDIKLGELLTFAGLLFYLVLLIVGCVICGKIAKLDGGMGMISVGAYPILVIILSILFCLLSVSLLVIKIKLTIKYPVLKDINP